MKENVSLSTPLRRIAMVNSSLVDFSKVALNQQAHAYAENGSYEVVCEIKECKNKTHSSKLHDWKNEKASNWMICPDCQPKVIS